MNVKKIPLKYFRYSLLILVIIFFIIFILLKKVNGDIWWHIKTGEYIAQHHQIPTSDFFSLTAYGNDWIAHSWLSDIIIYVTDTYFHQTGLIILNVILVLISIFFLLMTNRIITKNQTDIFLYPLLILLGLSCWSNLVLRPYLVYYIFFLCYQTILNSVKFKHSRIRILFILPVLQLLWSNLHGSQFNGIVILVVFIVGEILNNIFKRSDYYMDYKTLKILAFVLLLIIAVSFINPSGYKSLTYFTHYQLHSKYLNEWQSPFSAMYKNDYATWFFSIYIFISILVLTSTRKEIDITNLIFFMLLGSMAIRYNRQITIFFLVTLPYINKNLLLLYETGRIKLLETKKINIEQYTRYIYGAIILLVLALNINISSSGLAWSSKTKKTTISITNFTDYIPKKGVDFIIKNKISGYGWNSYDFGGYLIYRLYPWKRVFIDGRADPYPAEFLESYFNPTLDILNMMFVKYNINYCIVKYGEGAGLYQFLVMNDYVLVYFDNVCMVMVKYNGPDKELVKRLGYRVIHPVLQTLVKINRQTIELMKMEWTRSLRINKDLELSQQMLYFLNKAEKEYIRRNAKETKKSK